MIWEISRASAFTAYILFFFTITLGIIRSFGYLKKGALAFVTFFHKYAGISGIFLVLVHISLLLFDKYVPFSLKQLLIPFTASYKTSGAAMGTIGFYGFMLVVFTSTGKFMRYRNSHKKMWKAIHMLSYPAFLLSLYHGLITGTDSSNILVQDMYYITGITPLVLLFLRVFAKKKGTLANVNSAGGRRPKNIENAYSPTE